MADQKKPEEKKNKKIKKMNLDELNKAIENTNKNQGGTSSKYAQELLKQKNSLSSKK